MCDGRWTCRSRSLSCCRGRIAFRWYLPISNPYLLRRSWLIPCYEGAHTCFHLLNPGTTPSILSIRRKVAQIVFEYSAPPLVLYVSFCSCSCCRLFDASLRLMYQNAPPCWFRSSYLCFRRHIGILVLLLLLFQRLFLPFSFLFIGC